MVIFGLIYSSTPNLQSFRNLFSNSTDFESAAYEVLGNGKMADSSLTYSQYLSLVKSLEQQYPDLISTEVIGSSFNNQSIIAVKLSSKYSANKAILFTGMHHGREPVSMMMNLYILLKLLHMENSGRSEVYELINSVNVYFIPVINVDGYILNNEIYESGSDKYMIRKNRRNDKNTFNCINSEDYNSVSIGVDLNRNYGYKFGFDDQGSSGVACNDDYRGKSSFSEPETMAVKTFIENHKEIKIAFNYHSYGNLLITPFNYANPQDSALSLFMNYTIQKTVYDEFKNEGHFPDGFKQGNGAETIRYSANGEASDWMLGEKRIVAFSPELGTKDTMSDKFYPSKTIMFSILKSNLNSALYAITRASYHLQFLNLNKLYMDCEIVKKFTHKFLEKDEEELKEEKLCQQNYLQFSSQIQLQNKGFSDFKGEFDFELNLNVEFIEHFTIKINSGHKSINNNNNRNTTGTITGAPNNVIIAEKDYSRTTGVAKTHNKEIVNFKVNFIEGSNHQIMELKFYIDSKNLASILRLNDDLLNIRRVNKTDNFYEDLGLKFNNPGHKLKISEFNKFEMTLPINPPENKDKYTSNKYFMTYYRIVVLSILIGLFVVMFIILTKIRMYYSRVQNIRTAEDDRVNMGETTRRRNSYIELENTSNM